MSHSHTNHRNWQLIAEVKTESPFGFRSSKSWQELFEIANQYGDMISVHTDSRWGGSFDLIAKARKLTKKPILAKGIHATDTGIVRALDNGADKVLVVGRLPSKHIESCLIEPNSLSELTMLSQGTMAVWNARDLTTGQLKKEDFAVARKSWKGWLCQASFLRTAADVLPGADAVLVGEHLQEFVDSLQE